MEAMRWICLVWVLVGGLVCYIYFLIARPGRTREVEEVVLYCRLPGCRKRRRKRDGHYTNFCSPDHAATFGSRYCLYPGCSEVAMKNHFCSKFHFWRAVKEGISGLAKLDPSDNHFNDLKRHFTKSWCSKKGRLPKILSILEIVNPSLQKTFERYVHNLTKYKSVEQYYHGTQIQCDMLEYYEPCSNSSCGVCGISKKGFDPKRIQARSWQRFGKGFYFAPNSSKSYDYPRVTHQHSGSKHRCMLVCDIAPGRKYHLYKNDSSIKGPPKGYHSVYGNATWLWGFWKSKDLNYDELVVFDTQAIRPRYILFLEDTGS